MRVKPCWIHYAPVKCGMNLACRLKIAQNNRKEFKQRDLMNKLITTLGALLISMTATAETISQRTAKEMAAVLQSEQVQNLLVQDDGIGSIKGIKYLMSYRASYGPAIYELSFQSNSGPVAQICTLPVQVNIQTVEVVKVDSATCSDLK